MRKIPLLLLFQYFRLLSAFSQPSVPTDSSNYQEKKLKIEEVNIVSGYYHQDGNNSAVTGGIGTENLTDFANTFELKLVNGNKSGKTHSVSAEFGVDHYSSASSDNIDPRPTKSVVTSSSSSSQNSGKSQTKFVLSSASKSDVRIYPSLAWNVHNEKTGLTFGLNISYSSENDYKSKGAGFNIIKSSKNNNSEFSLKFQAFLDDWHVIYPYELRPPGYGSGSRKDPLPTIVKPRDSYQMSMSFAHVVNKRLQLSIMFDPSYQMGQLSTLYQRVYFNTGIEKAENLPSSRIKIPIGLRANYFLGDRIILRTYYRYYQDDWGIKAHTFNLEVPVKLSPFVSLSPFCRIHMQRGANYFAPYLNHDIHDLYYTSDYDLSSFNSQFIGMGIRLVPTNGVLGFSNFNTLEIRYGHYLKTTGLMANNISLAMKFK